MIEVDKIRVKLLILTIQMSQLFKKIKPIFSFTQNLIIPKKLKPNKTFFLDWKTPFFSLTCSHAFDDHRQRQEPGSLPFPPEIFMLLVIIIALLTPARKFLVFTGLCLSVSSENRDNGSLQAHKLWSASLLPSLPELPIQGKGRNVLSPRKEKPCGVRMRADFQACSLKQFATLCKQEEKARLKKQDGSQLKVLRK